MTMKRDPGRQSPTGDSMVVSIQEKIDISQEVKFLSLECAGPVLKHHETSSNTSYWTDLSRSIQGRLLDL